MQAFRDSRSLNDTDVLVAGAGPTGLFLAAELARHGVKVIIVDKALGPTTLSKALVVHARTLEIFDAISIAEPLMARGEALRGVTAYADNEPLVSVDFDTQDTRFPYLLSVPQADTEAVLGDWLARLGGKVEWGTEVRDLTQNDDFVSVQVESPDGPRTIVARWVVGCDGSRSDVRRLLGLTFEGATYDEQFALGDVIIDGDLPRDRASSFLAADGVCAIFPLRHGRSRIIAAVTDEHVAGDAPTLEELQAIVLARSHWPLRLSDPSWMSRFRIHARQVNRYRSGRVFLAGDAAHVHSPVGGQGMNTGLQDAHNLAFKLAFACRSDLAVSEALLDSYHAERQPIGENVLRGTDLVTKIGTLRSPLARSVRNALIRFVMSFDIVERRLLREMSELTIGYANSPIVREARGSLVDTIRLGDWKAFDDAPRAGAFLPDAAVHSTPSGDDGKSTLHRYLDTRRFSLLIFEGRVERMDDEPIDTSILELAKTARARYPALVDPIIVTGSTLVPRDLPADTRVIFDRDGELETRFGAVAACLYCVRPDLYIGFRSQPVQPHELFAYIDALFMAA